MSIPVPGMGYGLIAITLHPRERGGGGGEEGAGSLYLLYYVPIAIETYLITGFSSSLVLKAGSESGWLVHWSNFSFLFSASFRGGDVPIYLSTVCPP